MTPPIIGRIREMVRLHTTRLALEESGETLTYGELWACAQETAVALGEAGVLPGATVALLLPRSADWVIGLLAVWLLEAVALPLEPSTPPERLARLLAEAQPAALLTLEPLTGWTCLRPRRLEGKALFPLSFPRSESRDLRPAYLIYTSGSGGQPKGVLVSHAGLLSVLDSQTRVFAIDRDSRCFWMHGLAFDASLSDVLTALISGATLCFARVESVTRDPAQLLALLEQMRITHLDVPPALLAYLPPERKPETLRTVIIGGEVCPAPVVRAWAARCRVVNVYGPTEATICTSMVVCDSQWSQPFIGEPLAEIRYHLRDAAGEPVPVGSTGELWIEGEVVALGYPWNLELTAARFDFTGPRRIYRTGDLAVQRPEGLEFRGRLDRQEKLHGKLVCPEEVEAILTAQSGVRRAFVFISQSGPRPVLAAALELAASLEVASLRAACARFLPTWMIPARWLPLPALPSLPNGKPDAAALERLLATSTAPTAGEPPHGELERAVAGLFAACLQRFPVESSPTSEDEAHQAQVDGDVPAPWQNTPAGGGTLGGEVVACGRRSYPWRRDVAIHPSPACVPPSTSLERESSFSRDDDFFALGGDSLGVIEFLSRAVRQGLTVSADLIHRGRTVAGIAALIEAGADSEAMPCAELQQELEAAWLGLPLSAFPCPGGNAFLLTGATGFLGSAVLGELLAHTERPLICLVRDAPAVAQQRTIENLWHQGRGELISTLTRRVQWVRGDLAQPRLGLEPARWETLAAETEAVFHLAADIRLFRPFADLRATNVTGTRHLLELCLAGAPKPLHYASTLSVFVDADPPTAVCQETDLREAVTHAHGGYAQTKWVAEQLVRRAQRERGLPVSIYRLGLLTAHTGTGHAPAHDWLATVLRQLPAQPPSGAEAWDRLHCDVTPVDFAARALAWLALHAPAAVYHLAGEVPVSLADLAAARARVPQPRGWRESSTPAAHLASEHSHRSLHLAKATGVRFATEHTRAALHGSGLVFPEITPRLFGKLRAPSLPERRMSHPRPARTGMLLGKFLPPHLGHVYLGEFAAGFVEHLTIVVCTLEREPIPGALRFAWMQALFPRAHVVHLPDDLPQEPREHPDFWAIWTDALTRLLPHPPEVVFASEPYGQKLAAVLGARFVPADPGRTIRPVSGTAVRRDPFAHWDLLPLPVRAWYARRICVFGPESTGKSTLTLQLAAHFSTLAVPEYARTFLERQSGTLTEPDLLDIARGQIASEEALAPYANRLLFTDTDVLSTAIWSQALYGRTDPSLLETAAQREYDLYLLLDIDVPWQPDSVRYLPRQRAAFLALCEEALCSRGHPYLKLSGSWEERFQRAVQACAPLLETVRPQPLRPTAAFSGR